MARFYASGAWLARTPGPASRARSTIAKFQPPGRAEPIPFSHSCWGMISGPLGVTSKTPFASRSQARGLTSLGLTLTNKDTQDIVTRGMQNPRAPVRVGLVLNDQLAPRWIHNTIEQLLSAEPLKLAAIVFDKRV